jgi:tetratricopeptide (TPR) repeat protein|eukprot:gene1524-gene1665
MLENVRGIQAAENSSKIEEVERRLKDINEKIQLQQQKQREASAGSSSSLGGQRPDWTNSYKVWQDWVDVDELERKREATESQIENLYNQKDVLGHVHDHSEERKFFHLPEEEKIRKCEQYKILGNYLFEEGMFDRAAKQYQTAIGFYEYIFPEDPKVQEDVDSLRIKCLCNLALCLIRLKEFRKAVEVCSSVIEADPHNYPKAFFRRGLAHKKLDEYE